ncbi:MAG: hypothetical protein V4702_00735 [Patescibacteria group bacterium]
MSSWKRFGRQEQPIDGSQSSQTYGGVKIQTIKDFDNRNPTVYELLVGSRNPQPHNLNRGEEGSMSLAVPGLMLIGYLGIRAAQETWGSPGRLAMGCVAAVALVLELRDPREV